MCDDCLATELFGEFLTNSADFIKVYFGIGKPITGLRNFSDALIFFSLGLVKSSLKIGVGSQRLMHFGFGSVKVVLSVEFLFGVVFGVVVGCGIDIEVWFFDSTNRTSVGFSWGWLWHGVRWQV